MGSEELEEWMATRVGYGSLKAHGWFLGLEESCHCDSELDIRVRGGAVDDLEQFLLRAKSCYPHLLSDEPDLQSTWRPLMRTWILATEAREATQLQLRHYQRRRWGRSDGDHLLVEILPLPSPNTKVWLYNTFAASRAAYEAAWIPKRVAFLKRLWANWPIAPRVAVAYGKQRWPEFMEIFGLAGRDRKRIETNGGEATGYRLDNIGVVLTEHPQSHGLSDGYWNPIGRWLRSVLFGTTGPVGRPIRRRARNDGGGAGPK